MCLEPGNPPFIPGFESTPLRQGLRDTDVDIAQIHDQEQGDFFVGWNTPGEWLRYTVNVLETGEGLSPAYRQSTDKAGNVVACLEKLLWADLDNRSGRVTGMLGRLGCSRTETCRSRFRTSGCSTLLLNEQDRRTDQRDN